MKARYLTFYSYLGTHFRSSEKIWLREGRNYPDPESIQGAMEMSLLKLKSLNYPKITLSSRTDGGVHALNSSAHFDLEKYGMSIYDPNSITYQMNKYFYKANLGIYVRKCLRVSDDFNARFNAISRTYLYRLAVLKKEVEILDYVSIASHIPIEEWKRCHFIRLKDFDIDRLKDGAKHLVGYHDFSTFKKFDTKTQEKNNRREIYSIDVRPGRPLVNYETQDSPFEHWDIEIKGRAFVHNQIRRMMGTLISVAIGKLPSDEVKVMLQVPSKHSWHNFIQNCPPDGLYLVNIEYNPEDLVYKEDSTSKQIYSDSDSE